MSRLNSLDHPWYSPKEMHRRSTLWFVLAAAWAVLLVLNMLRHRDLNTLVIGIAVAAFVVTGAVQWHREKQTAPNKKVRQ